MAPRSIHLIVNPVAGRGNAMRILGRAREQFARIGTVHVWESRHRAHELQLARHAAENRASAIIVIGGDGSLSHAARGVIASGIRVPLGVLSAGTGNDFSKSLGAPVTDCAATVDLVADRVVRSIDVGLVNDQPFINAAGFGFDADVLSHTLGPSMVRGRLRYATSALQHLFSYPGFEAHFVDADGAQTSPFLRDRWLTLVFANGRWFGGTFQIAPDAAIDDGHIDCIAIHDASAMQRAALFTMALRGAHVRSSAVEAKRSTSFTLQFPQTPRYQIDGELAMATSNMVVIGTLPSALEMFCG